MAEPATNATLATVDVDVHARMDTFERDLTRVRALLEGFDTAAGKSTKKLKELETSSTRTAAASREYSVATGAAKTSTDATTSSVDRANSAQRELARTIAASEAMLKKFDMATTSAMTNQAKGNTTWAQAAENATNTGKSWFKTGTQILEVAGYIKLAAAVAHAGSPVFRAFTDNVLGGFSNWMKLSPAVGAAKDAIAKFTPEAVKNSSALAGLASGIGKVVEAYKPFKQVSEAVELGMLAKNFPIAAAGAMALSPALRQVVGQQMTEGAKSLGPAIAAIAPAASVAGSAIGSFLIPRLVDTLAFVSRIAVPVLAAVSFFKLLGFSISQAFERMAEARKAVDILEGTTKKKKDDDKPPRMVSEADLHAAAELQKRMDDASKILSQKWIPLQEKLIQLGMVFIKGWVVILETTVKIVQFIEKLPDLTSKWIDAAIRGIPVIGQLYAIWQRMTSSKEGPKIDLNDILPNEKWDAAVARIEKQTVALKAEAAAVGKSIEFKEQLRIEMQLLEAASETNKTVTEESTKAFTELRVEGKSLEEALEKAGIKLRHLGDAFKELSTTAATAKKEIAIGQVTRQLEQDAKAAEIATRALTARSPAAKADIAAAQERLKWEKSLKDETVTRAQVDEAAARARKLAYDTEISQIREISRQRLLTADQSIKTAETEIRAIGKSVGERHRLLTIEQTRQQLESEAAARGGVLNQRELAALTERINRVSTLKQIEAERQASLEVQFQLQTVFMTDTERQIAAVGFQLRGMDWKTFMDGGVAASMRVAASFKELNSTVRQIENDMVSAFTNIALNAMPVFVDGAANAAESFKKLSQSIIRSLTQLIVKMLVTTAIARAMNAALGMFTGAPVTAANTNTVPGVATDTSTLVSGDPALLSSVWPAMHSGGYVGRDISGYRRVPTSFLDVAPRLHTGLRRGEFPAILEQGERVIPRGGIGMDGSKTVINIMPVPGTSFEQQERKGSGGINFIDLIQTKQNENVAEGRQDAVLGARFGATPAGIRR